MAQHLLRQPNNDNTNINNDDDEEEEVVTLSVTPSKAVVDVDFNNNTGDEGGGGSVGGGIKAARLPRWTRQEILVLIQGKRVAENRVRRGRSAVLCEGSQGQQVEPKWATVSSYCKRHGVNRGPVQCRKRWSNLAGDFKKIKEWESLVKDEADSFWLMRNDLRREKKLPGFFDKEVFDILNNNNTTTTATATCSGSESLPPDSIVEPLFDSGRSAAADDGLFSDFEPTHSQQQQQQQQQDDEIMGDNDNQVEVEIKVEPQPLLLSSPNTTTTTIPAPTPISEKQYQPKTAEVTPPGRNNEKQQDRLNVEIGSTSREGRKRRRFMYEDVNNNNGEQDELCQVLEKNGRILSAQLDAYNINLKLDREERKDHANSLVAVLNKLADSLGRIADKL